MLTIKEQNNMKIWNIFEYKRTYEFISLKWLNIVIIQFFFHIEGKIPNTNIQLLIRIKQFY